MDDKYILMGLEDSRAGHVAEVLKNKTCKKILDFLADTKEASELDISKGLKMPINTAEYNLKKLIKAGLVEKTKNFFWSVKGKKIPMYKLARKHIIISPSKKPNLSYLKSILPAIIVAFAILVLVAFMFPRGEGPGEGPGTTIPPIIQETQLRQFSSQAELTDFIKENAESSDSNVFWGIFGGLARTGVQEDMAPTDTVTTSAGSAETKASVTDYSTTNIQVEGVDEADIVKNDDKYIYVVSGTKLVIVDAYPADDMKILSEIDLNQSAAEIFVNGDRLIVFASGYDYIPYAICDAEGIGCGGYSNYKSLIYIYDISDRENPSLEDKIEAEGNYLDSRMIGDYVYVISTKYVRTESPVPPVYIVNGVEKAVSAREVSYWPYPDTNYVFTSIMAIDTRNGGFDSQVYLTGSTGTVYVSQDNIFLTYQKRMNYEDYAEQIAEDVYFPLLSDEYDAKIQEVLDSDKRDYEKLNEMEGIVNKYGTSLSNVEMVEFSRELIERLEEFNVEIQKQMEKTVIHKINIKKDKIEYKGVGEVPGRILNQFSMDEYDGYFRIATTTGDTWQETSLNHLYVLDEDLEIVGSVEDLAKGERVYSLRFIGERAYLVTFRQVDPFYVIDLSDPEDPTVLGYLKIPGYSSYLHPYDENHVIGLGKDGRNLKLSLFDVSDVENPIEIDKYTIEGSTYSDSNALYEHKAFLFDREKKLLVIPVTYNKFIGYEKNSRGYEYPRYDYWQGAFVFKIGLINGFNLRGEISHREGARDWYYTVQRSLYMDNILYTISQKKIKANELDTLSMIKDVEIPYGGQVYGMASGGMVEEEVI